MSNNCINFEIADIENAKGNGSISTLAFDINVRPVASDGALRPLRIAFLAAHLSIECCWVRKKQNRDTGTGYLTLTTRG